MKLSVVIPAYNEEKNIEKGVLEEVYGFLEDQDYVWELLIVDDESTDKTAELAEKFAKDKENVYLHKEQHRGKGGTVIAGVLKAKGDIVLFTDMDQATPISEIDKFFPRFEQGYDIVIGSRSGRKGAPIVRKAMAFGFATLRILILGLPYKDTQCGFKAFKKEPAHEIFKKMKIYNENKKIKGSSVSAGFDLEVLYLAKKLGFKVTEIPVKWEHKDTIRVNPIRDSWQGLRDLVQVRLNSLAGKYRS